MKHKGDHFEYMDERDKNLMEVYHRELSAAHYISLLELMKRVVNAPARRFWVSEERAAIIISFLRRGGSIAYMSAQKQEMYREIYRRAVLLMDQQHDITMSAVAFSVCTQPAPKFYLTPESAKIIIHRIKKKWYKEQRKKYRSWLCP